VSGCAAGSLDGFGGSLKLGKGTSSTYRVSGEETDDINPLKDTETPMEVAPQVRRWPPPSVISAHHHYANAILSTRAHRVSLVR